MCEPRYFDVHYAINPWMNPEERVDRSRAHDQWNNLVQVYQDHGHKVDTVAPVEGLPDMVFAANAALVMDERVFGSSFHAPERQPESAAYAAWFKEAGYDVHHASAVCEGEGDLVPTGRYVLAGTGFRTQRDAHHEVQEFFGTPVVSLQLVDPRFYHLDTALFLLDEAGGRDDATGAGNVAYYPEAFSPGSREVLRRLFPEAVIASEEDALAFGLNSVSDGHHVFIAPQAQGLIDTLADRGYVPVPVDLSEFRKSGGGIKCCTQEIR
ncbi:dimethylargininase [Streptomyces sudanensis]|uniref:dimethylargininase n=1 Tax=Streptomyces sudanensis TaxID=436397 RepID=UPI0020CF5442|nr:dimethylargininase [Streptomyces sudanensis]MCP9956607.1 arginine deiminase-related protein [Streptomyces sudanensis]MCP9985808.1 arginine deiminase-related protein [Streptomyces sudanensis]